MYDSIKKELSSLKNSKEDDVISNETQNLILKKRNYVQKTTHRFLWKDFERSCELLEVRGARAIKLSYSSLNRQEVEIKLTNRRTCLTFETIKD